MRKIKNLFKREIKFISYEKYKEKINFLELFNFKNKVREENIKRL